MRILVADDDAGARLVLQAVLSKAGHEVIMAGDGAAAWDLLQQPHPPKLAVLDWLMPGLDGLEVVRRASGIFQHEPLYSILLTARDDKKDMVRALEAGANDYLTKPFHSPELLARVQVGVRVVNLQSALAQRLRELEGALAGRHQAEAALLEEQSCLRSLMDNLPSTIYFKDRFSRFTRINRELARRFCLGDPDQAVGKSDSDFFDPEHAAQALGDEERIIRTGEPLIDKEEREAWPDGRVTWVASTKMPLRQASGEIIGTFGVSHDITDRKRTEKALAEESRLVALRAEVGAALIAPCTLRRGLQHCTAALVEWTGVALARIWTLDHSAGVLILEASSGLYTHINGAHGSVPLGEKKIGRIARERQSHVSIDVQNDPEVGDREWAKREGMVSFVGHPLVMEDKVGGVVAAFGRRILSDATLLALSSIAVQIAQFVQAKRAEEAMLRSEERARLLFATIPHPAYVFDVETLDFLEVNDVAVRRYGYSREEFLRMKTTEIRPPEEVAKLEDFLHHQVHSSSAAAGQWKHRTRDGRVIDVEINSQFLDYDGRRAVLAIAQDVTERIKLEVGLRHAQKLEAVGGLASGIAHEINTPIQFVGDNIRFFQDGFRSLQNLIGKFRELKEAAEAGVVDGEALQGVNQALEEGDLDYLMEEIPKALEQSLDGVGRVATIVRAMKDFAHPEQKQMAAADLNKALASTLIVARNEVKYVADVTTDFGDLPLVECCMGDLNQVFLNLLVNAAHAIGDVVNGTGTKGMIRIQTRHEDGHVRIGFSDTGSGIPEAIRPKVFEPFFTTRAVGGGTGQGLAISRSIVVEKHGGTLTFETETGRGTTFWITLPVSNRTGERSSGEATPAL